MAFPTVAGSATTNGTTGTDSPVVNLPASIASGDLLLVLIRANFPNTFTFPAGWTELFDDSSDGSNDDTAIAWRKADGTEGATITLTRSATDLGKFAAIAWRITGAADPTVQAPELATLVTGASTLPDPGSLTPTGGAKDYLWLWMGGWEGEQASPPTNNPTNYTANILGADSGIAGTVPTNCRVASATRDLNAASEDPGSWTISVTDEWTATVVAVHPGGAAQAVTGSSIASGVALNAPAAAYVIAAAALASALTLFAPTVAAGPVTVAAAHIASGATLFAPAIVGPQTVDGAHLASTAALSAPSLAYQVAGAFFDAANRIGAGVFEPAAAYAVTGAHLASGAALSVPSAAYAVSGATLASGSTLTAPTVAVTASGAHIASTTTLSPPTISQIVQGAHLASTASLGAPAVHAPAGGDRNILVPLEGRRPRVPHEDRNILVPLEGRRVKVPRN